MSTEPLTQTNPDDPKDSETPATSPERKRRSWLRRWFVRTTMVLAVLIGGAILVSQTRWGEERGRELAIAALEGELGLAANIEHLEVTWAYWPPGLVLSATGIDLDHPTEGDLVEAETLIIRPSLGAFFRGEVDLAEIEIEAPRIHLRIDEDGRLINVPELPTSDSGPSDLPFGVIDIRRAAVSIDVGPLAQGRLGPMDIHLEADGRRMEIDLRSRRGVIDHPDGREDIEELLVEGSIDLDGEAHLDNFRLRTPYLKVRVREGEVLFPEDEAVTWSAHTQIEFNIGHIHHLPIPVELPPLEGRLLIQADISGDDQGPPRGRGEVRIIDGRIDHQWGLGDEVLLRVEVSASGVTLEEGSEVRLISDGGTLGLHGTISFDEDLGFPVDIETDLDLQFAQLIEQLSVTSDTPVWWPIDGHGALTGTLSPLDLRGPIAIVSPNFLITIDPHHVRPRQRVISVSDAHLSGQWRIDEEALRFENISLVTHESRLFAPIIHLGFDNVFRAEINGHFDTTDVSPLVMFDLEGSGPVQVHVTGDFSDPIVNGHMEMNGFSFDTFNVGHVESDWAIVRDYYAVHFPRVEAEKGQSRFTVDDLLFDFTEHAEVTAQLHGSRMALSDVYETFHYEEDERYTPYLATARGDMSIRFTHGFPSDGPNGTLESDFDFEILDAEFAGFAFDHGSLAGRFQWFDFTQGLDQAVMDLDHLVLHKGQGTINIAGIVEHSNLRMSVLADQFAIQQTEGIGESFPQLAGTYTAVGQVQGTVDVPRLDMDVDVTGLSWDGVALGDARAYIRLTDRTDPWVAEAADWAQVPEGEICGHARMGLAQGQWQPSPPIQTVEGPMRTLDRPMAFLVCGEGLGGSVETDMAFGWTDVYPARGVINLNDVQLTPLIRQYQSEASASLTGQIRLDGGAMMRDGSLMGEVILTELRMAMDQESGLALSNSADVKLGIVRGGVQFRQARFQGYGSELSLTGNIDAAAHLALSADGVFDLASLGRISHDLESSGDVRFHVDLGGPMDNPTMLGEAQVRDGDLQFEGMPAGVENLQGTVRFSQRRAVFEDFSAIVAGGPMTLTGTAQARGGSLAQYELEIGLRNATLVPDEGIEVGVGMTARLAWAEGDRLPMLTGQVDLDRVEYRRPVQLSPTLGQLYRPQRTEVERYDPADDRVAIDMRLAARRPAHIQNNMMDVRILINDAERPFRIVGTDQRWGVIGNLSLPRGQVRFRNTDLEVTEGEIRFDDPTRVDPQFDVLAITEIRRQQGSGDLTGQAWRVQVRAHGNLDGFQLDADSQPPLSQEDLMLLLTVGLTSAEAQQLQAGDVGGTALEALSAISGVNEEVVSALGVIDDFAITTRYSPDTGRPEPMLTVGKRITERVRLSASTGLTGESRTFQAGLEWRVSPQTSVQAVYDNINRESASNLGNVGIDLHWRLEFE